jgi:hypothetical protein
MRWILITTLVFTIFIMTGPYAATVTVTMTTTQQQSGVLTNVYYETADGVSGSTPSVNTALNPPTGTGHYTITRGSSTYLWSPQFANSIVIPAQAWVLDMWVSGASSGTMTITIVTTDSSGTTSKTVVSGVSTGSISNSESQVVTTFSGVQATIPANGYIQVTLTAPTGPGNPKSFTVYWGAGQLTDFQVMMSVLST